MLCLATDVDVRSRHHEMCCTKSAIHSLDDPGDSVPLGDATSS